MEICERRKSEWSSGVTFRERLIGKLESERKTMSIGVIWRGRVLRKLEI